MDLFELASRVKFESNSVIRFLTRDKRDILFRLDGDEQTVHYIGEVKVDNLLKKRDHKIAHHEYDEEFELLKQTTN